MARLWRWKWLQNTPIFHSSHWIIYVTVELSKPKLLFTCCGYCFIYWPSELQVSMLTKLLVCLIVTPLSTQLYFWCTSFVRFVLLLAQLAGGIEGFEGLTGRFAFLEGPERQFHSVFLMFKHLFCLESVLSLKCFRLHASWNWDWCISHLFFFFCWGGFSTTKLITVQ